MPDRRQLDAGLFLRSYDCPMRLRHALDRLPSSHDEDDHLRMLAEGGFQFQKVVRASWPGETMHSASEDPAAAAAATIERIRGLLGGSGVLHDAVFMHGDFLARVDMLRIEGDWLVLCKIKAKAADGPTDGQIRGEATTDAAPGILATRGRVASTWQRYVADVAFQTVVVERALAEAGLGDLRVAPRLVVANRNAACGEFDHFGNLRTRVGVAATSRLDATDFEFVRTPPPGFFSPLVLEVDVATAVERLRTESAESKSAEWADLTLEQLMDRMAAILRGGDASPDAERGWKCKECEFRARGARDGRPVEGGFDRCWGARSAVANEVMSLYRGQGYRPYGTPLDRTGDLGNFVESLYQAAAAEDRDRTEGVAVRIGPLNSDDARQAWNRSCMHEHDGRSTGGPRFDWDALARIAPALAKEALHPLTMQILLSEFDGKRQPQDLPPEEVYERHVATLRNVSPEVAELLSVLADDMLVRRAGRFDTHALYEQGHGRLLWSTSTAPRSALDVLLRRGVLSRLSDLQRTADVNFRFTFTMDRIAEQVLGQHLANEPSAAHPEALARLADSLLADEVSLAAGAVRVALRVRSRQNLPFLAAFIDAGPRSVGSLAGEVVAWLLLGEIRNGSAGPTRSNVLDEVFSTPSEHDLAVMHAVLEWMAARIDASDHHDDERHAVLPVLRHLIHLTAADSGFAHGAAAVLARHLVLADEETVRSGLECLRRHAESNQLEAVSSLCMGLRSIAKARPNRIALLEECIAREQAILDPSAADGSDLQLASDLNLLGRLRMRGSEESDVPIDYAGAIDAYEQAIAVVASSTTDDSARGADLTLESHRGLHKAFLGTRRFRDAHEVATKALQTASEPSDRLDFLMMMATLLLRRDTGGILQGGDAGLGRDRDAALKALDDALALARRTIDRGRIVDVLSRIGRTKLPIDPCSAANVLREAITRATEPTPLPGVDLEELERDRASASRACDQSRVQEA